MKTEDKIHIREFKITGLHGDKDIELSFDSPYKILVAENGTGKTTVLNSLFYWLTGQYRKLSRIEFEKLELTFFNDDKIELLRSDIYLEIPDSIEKSLHYSRLRSYIGNDLARVMLKLAMNSDSLKDIRDSPEFASARVHFTVPINEIYRTLERIIREISGEDIFTSALANNKQKINDLLPFDILYLPTYRRVEEDLQRLGYEGEFIDNENQLIHFGMKDVTRSFQEITKEINDSTLTWFSTISGRMLDELTTLASVDKDVDKDNLKQSMNPVTLGIVLDRIGQNISKDRKTEILDLVNSSQIYEDKYNTLAYFLSNLVKIYDQQRDKDKKIKEFVRVASKYLVNKEVRYDESRVTITIVNIRTEKEVALEKLSSGEKQLISILSKLYLESEKPNLIIFDEPELSLSIEWQKDLLPDIIASGQCELLLAATHSPFIFENELDRYAEALNVHYREHIND